MKSPIGSSFRGRFAFSSIHTLFDIDLERNQFSIFFWFINHDLTDVDLWLECFVRLIRLGSIIISQGFQVHVLGQQPHLKSRLFADLTKDQWRVGRLACT